MLYQCALVHEQLPLHLRLQGLGGTHQQIYQLQPIDSSAMASLHCYVMLVPLYASIACGGS